VSSGEVGHPERHQRVTAAGLAAAGGAVVLLSLGFGSVPLTLRAQGIPAASLCALLLLVPVLLVTRFRPLTPILGIVAAFAGFAFVHSLVALGVEALGGTLADVRVLSWARQVVALFAGVAVFLVLRATLMSLKERTVAGLLVAGTVPNLVLALINVVWGVSGWEGAGGVVKAARSAIVPLGLAVPSYYTVPNRVAGFFLEPAQLAFYLAVVAVPVTVALALAPGRGRDVAFAALVAELLAFFWAYSGTGYAVGCGMLLALALADRRVRVWGLAAIATILLSLLAMSYVFPGNYLQYQLTSLASGVLEGDLTEAGVSVSIPVCSSFGPFARVFSSLNLLGYGLGGAATHLPEMVPAAALVPLTAGSWQGMPNLATSLGRVFVETGLAGLLLFASLWVVAFRTLGRLRAAVPARSLEGMMLVAAALALVGIAVGHTVKFGSYAAPYLWFWLAYVDSRYLLNGRQLHQD